MGNKVLGIVALILFALSAVSSSSAYGQTSTGNISEGSASVATETGSISLQGNVASSFSGSISGNFSGTVQGTLIGKANGIVTPGPSETYDISFNYSGSFATGAKTYHVEGKGKAQASSGSISSGSLNGTMMYLNSQFIFGELSGDLSGGPGSYSTSTTYIGSNLTSTLSVKANFSGSFVRYYIANFSESGLPSGTTWSVKVSQSASSTSTSTSGIVSATSQSPNLTLYSSSSSIFFALPNGQYDFSVGSVAGYVALPSSGSFTVENANLSELITFSEVSTVTEHAVTFSESGLPSGTTWSVTLNGVSESTSSTQITFQEPSGTYSYSVKSPSGYSASPDSGTISVLTSNALQLIAFSQLPPTTYDVTFKESGLPSGTTWSVTLLGTTKSSATSMISFIEPPGTYSYSIIAPSGYKSSSSQGSITVTGTTTQLITFFALTHQVTFSESGLPSGTTWSVTLNGTAKSSSLTSIAFAEPTGNYRYSIGSVAGYVPLPSSGVLAVNGTASSVSIAFSKQAYEVSFVQTDLLPYSQWAVKVDGTTVYSTGHNATFYLPAGTYSYSVQPPPDRYASPSSGMLHVSGNVVQQIDFPLSSAPSANPSSYAKSYFKSNPEGLSASSSQSYYTAFPPVYYGYNETPFYSSNPYQQTNVPSIPPYVYSPTLYFYSSLLNEQSLLPSIPTGVALTYVTDHLSNGSMMIAISTTGVASAEAGDWMTVFIHSPTDPQKPNGNYSDELTYKVTVTTVVIEDASAGFLTNVGLTSIQAEYQVPFLGTVTHVMRLKTSAAMGNPFDDPADDEGLWSEIGTTVEVAKLYPEFVGVAGQLYDVINANLTNAIIQGEKFRGANASLPQDLASDMEYGLLNPYVEIYRDSYCNTLVIPPGESLPVSGGIKIVAGNSGIGTTDIYVVSFVQVNVYPGVVLAPPSPKGPYIRKVALTPDKLYVNQLPNLTAEFGDLFLNGKNYNATTNTWTDSYNGGFYEGMQYPTVGIDKGGLVNLQQPSYAINDLTLQFGNSTSVDVGAPLGRAYNGANYVLPPGTYNVSLFFDGAFGAVSEGPPGQLMPWPGNAEPPNLTANAKLTVLPLPSNTSIEMRSLAKGGGNNRIWVGQPVQITGLTDEEYWVDHGPQMYLKPAGWLLFYAGLQNSSSPAPAYKSQLIANVSVESQGGGYGYTTNFEADANWTPSVAGNYTITVVYTGYPTPGSKDDLITGSTQVISDVQVLALGPTLTLTSTPNALGNFSRAWTDNVTLHALFQNNTYSGAKPMQNESIEFYIKTPAGLAGAYGGFALSPYQGTTNSKGIANVTLLITNPPSEDEKLTLVAVAVPPSSSTSGGGGGGGRHIICGPKFSPTKNTNATVVIEYVAPQVLGPQLLLSAKPSEFGRLTLTPSEWINSTNISALLLDTTSSAGGQGTSTYYVMNEGLQFWIVTPNGLSTSYSGFSLSDYGYVSTNDYGRASLTLSSSASDDQNATLTLYVQSVPPSSGGGGGSHHAEQASGSSAYVPVNGTISVVYYVKTVSYHGHHMPHTKASVEEEVRSYEVTQLVSSMSGKGYGEISVGHHVYST
ncbi:MAG: hypothetical protein ACP5SK_02260 [Thermoprotei archaeon]